MAQVLRGEYPKDAFRGKTVLIGANCRGSGRSLLQQPCWASPRLVVGVQIACGGLCGPDSRNRLIQRVSVKVPKSPSFATAMSECPDDCSLWHQSAYRPADHAGLRARSGSAWAGWALAARLLVATGGHVLVTALAAYPLVELAAPGSGLVQPASPGQGDGVPAGLAEWLSSRARDRSSPSPATSRRLDRAAEQPHAAQALPVLGDGEGCLIRPSWPMWRARSGWPIRPPTWPSRTCPRRAMKSSPTGVPRRLQPSMVALGTFEGQPGIVELGRRMPLQHRKAVSRPRTVRGANG